MAGGPERVIRLCDASAQPGNSPGKFNRADVSKRKVANTVAGKAFASSFLNASCSAKPLDCLNVSSEPASV
jgi:hypothetical protein